MDRTLGMRIKIDGIEYPNVTLESKGNTIVAGMRVAYNGKLHDFVEDITEYRTEIDEDGNKIQVEVIPEVDIG